MNLFLRLFSVMALATTLAGCATTPKQAPAPASAPAPAAPDLRDEQIRALQGQLDEQKVRAAEAEARAAKAENDLREKELLKSSKPSDPYLK